MRSQDNGGANADVNLMGGTVETTNFGYFCDGLEKGRWLTVDGEDNGSRSVWASTRKRRV